MIRRHGARGRALRDPPDGEPGAGARSAVTDAGLLARGNRSYRAWRNRFAEAAGLHAADVEALVVIDENPGPVPSSELATIIGLTKSGVTCLVDRLSASGHLQRQDHPRDRRKVLISCTPAGHAVADGFRAALAATVSAAVSDLDPDSVDQAGEVLDRLADRLPCALPQRA